MFVRKALADRMFAAYSLKWRTQPRAHGQPRHDSGFADPGIAFDEDVSATLTVADKVIERAREFDERPTKSRVRSAISPC